MKKLLLGLILLLLPITGFSHSVTEEEKRAIYQAEQSMVRIVVPNIGAGSGWFITQSIIITNFHVVEGWSTDEQATGKVNFLAENGEQGEVSVMFVDPVLDVAVLLVKGPYTHPYKVTMDFQYPERMTRVWAMGYPGGLDLMVTEGYYQYYDEPTKCHVATAPIFFGNSGGGLFLYNEEDKEMHLIGMPTQVSASGMHAYSHGVCAKSAASIDEFLTSLLGSLLSLPHPNLLQEKTMPYKKKPAPAHLSKSQKKDWNMNEEAKFQRSMKKDKRSVSDIAGKAPKAEPKSAEKTDKEGTARQSKNAETIVKELRKKKGHPTTFFKK